MFTDANTMFEPEALRALVAPFADPEVGGVAGDQRYLPAGGSRRPDAAGERSYWDFDRRVKLAESAAGSTVAATGAIYAIRRELFQPVIAGVTDDFITSTAVIDQGRRLVFAPDAVAWEPVAASNRLEYRRKVRIMTRGLRGVAARRELLDPRRTGFYAVQLVSHKVLRRLMAIPLLVVAAGAPLLWGEGALYQLTSLGAAAVAGLGAVGLAAPRVADRPPAAGRLAAFFCWSTSPRSRPTGTCSVAGGSTAGNRAGRQRTRPATSKRADTVGPDPVGRGQAMSAHVIDGPPTRPTGRARPSPALPLASGLRHRHRDRGLRGRRCRRRGSPDHRGRRPRGVLLGLASADPAGGRHADRRLPAVQQRGRRRRHPVRRAALRGAVVPMILVVPLGYELLIKRRPIVVTPAFPWVVGFLLIQIMGTLFARDMSARHGRADDVPARRRRPLPPGHQRGPHTGRCAT